MHYLDILQRKNNFGDKVRAICGDFCGPGCGVCTYMCTGMQMHACDLRRTIVGKAQEDREVNKYKFLEVKDSVLVSSLCPAPDAVSNSEQGLIKCLPGSL